MLFFPKYAMAGHEPFESLNDMHVTWRYEKNPAETGFFSSSFRTQVLHASYDSSHLDVKKYTHKPLSSQDSYAAVRERLRR